MIIKSLSRKRPTFLQLARYILKEGKGKAICHNMLSDSDEPSDLSQEIEENCKYMPARKGRVIIFHDILSWHFLDRKNLDEAKLTDLAAEYMEKRLGDRGMGFGGIHVEKEHIHVHIMCAGNLIGSQKKLRLSKRKFETIKKEMSLYAKERYPELVYSYDHAKKRSRAKVKERSRENQRAQRLKEEGSRVLSKKEQAREAVLGSLEKATSNKEFLDLLKRAGYQVYRRGKYVGIIRTESGTRYRLKTLGVSEVVQEKIKNYERFKEQLKELESTQSRRGLKRGKGKERE